MSRAIQCFLFVFCITASGCSGQPSTKLTPRDTLHLYSPKPEHFAVEDTAMFRNCVILFQPGYIVNRHDSAYTCNSLTELTNYLQRNMNEIRKSKFYLISDSSTDFSKIVSVLVLMGDLKIDRYTVINYQEYFRLPDPVVVSQPVVSVSESKTRIDSTYFVITIEEKEIAVEFHNRKAHFKDATGLSNFIKSNQAVIDKNKILVTASDDLSYKRFEQVVDVLKKYQYTKYSLVTK